MHILKAAILALVPLSAAAADPNPVKNQEAFARAMMMCAAKNTMYALGPGDASIAANAAPKSESYVNAAIKAAGEKYVADESQKVQEEALPAVIESIKATGDIFTNWNLLLKDCDAQLSANSTQGSER